MPEQVSKDKINIAVFASGAGSNAQKIIHHFRNSNLANVRLIVTNNEKAGVIRIAEQENINVQLLDKKRFFEDGYLIELQKAEIRFIVLAGFLWKIPQVLIDRYRNKIINIHPALLPNYGGKGMYGQYVHEAVINAKEQESGITIHYVDEHYDNGDIIFQEKCPITETDTPETLASKIHLLEHQHYPRVIEELIKEQFK